MGLVEDFLFTRGQTDLPVKFSFTGPFSLMKRIRNEGYPDDAGLVLAIASHLNREARALAAAGAARLQIDEPFLAGYPEQTALAVRGINAVVEGVDVEWGVHICYGNRHARPAWEGHYDFLFPEIMEAHVGELVLEFARKGYDDLDLFRKYHPPFALGLGVIDVKSSEVESPDVIAARIANASDVVAPDRIVVNPDCGLRHLSGVTARSKLRAMSAGAALARAKLTGTKAEREVIHQG